MNNNYLSDEFKKEFKQDFEEFWSKGSISRATRIKEEIGGLEEEQIRNDVLPYPFFGDIFSEFVFVNYNPGVSTKTKMNIESYKKDGINSFEEYYNWLSQFGKRRYGEGTKELKPDGFDVKVTSYLIPFDELFGNFKFERLGNQSETYSFFPNLEKSLSNKCQLEFIPYGSQKFNPGDFKGKKITSEYFDRLLKMIFAVKRKMVIFNGAMFYDLLESLKRDDIKLERRNKFKLIRKDGTLTEKEYTYSVCEITYNGQSLKCIINHALPIPGFSGTLPEQYARVIIENEFK